MVNSNQSIVKGSVRNKFTKYLVQMAGIELPRQH